VSALEPFFTDLGGGRFRSGASTAGPWDPGLQHAGPPAALIGRALEACAPRDDMALARVTLDILGPVPVSEVAVAASVARPGRSVELLEATLSAGGRVAVVARAWRVARRGAPPAGDAAAPPPIPDTADPPALFPGYGEAVEFRFARGGWREPGPATVWTRLRVPVVAGEAPTGLQRVLAVADSGSGVSAVLPFGDWMFINPELSVHLRREAVGEWICLDAVTTVEPDGAGLARSTLSDARGPVAHGAQALLVAPRR
jgi:Thioesterase-like superfamily